MKKTNFFFLTVILGQLLFASTQEQIEQYLSISKSDNELIQIEQVFDSMRQDVESDNNNTQEINQIYKEYLQEHLSNNEADNLLALYRTPIMQRYVIEMESSTVSQEDMRAFLEDVKENPLSSEREDIIEEILKVTVNDKQVLAFYKSMTQRYTPIKKQEDNSTKKMSKQEERYLEMMKKGTRNALLYGTQVLSNEEMHELNKALHSSILSKTAKIESEAMVYVMNGFIKSITSKPKVKKSEKEKNLSQ